MDDAGCIDPTELYVLMITDVYIYIYYDILCHIILNYIILYYILLYYIILYFIIFCYIILYYIVLYYIRISSICKGSWLDEAFASFSIHAKDALQSSHKAKASLCNFWSKRSDWIPQNQFSESTASTAKAKPIHNFQCSVSCTNRMH
jgi:hypothetical protein